MGRAVNKKLLVALSAIGAQQAAATEDTSVAIEKILDYVATYPNDGILFRKRKNDIGGACICRIFE